MGFYESMFGFSFIIGKSLISFLSKYFVQYLQNKCFFKEINCRKHQYKRCLLNPNLMVIKCTKWFIEAVNMLNANRQFFLTL